MIARVLSLLICLLSMSAPGADKRPNILLAISDDQSFPHCSAYGYKTVNTPGFDRVAKLGAKFNNAYAGSPGCSPSRAALLTGRHHWQLEEAGTHASAFPKKYACYPDLLESAGYVVGQTGKGWGPGDWKVSGRERNPAGPAFSRKNCNPPVNGISKNDYAANFEDFLSERPKDKPFCFWYGATEPHRGYEKGSGLKSGKKLEDVVVPAFLPDTPEVRSDILDYCVEIEWSDQHLLKMLELLEKAGELQNTIVIVTADNGMPFPRAKANCYDYGIHVPLAICWPEKMPGGRSIDDVVGFVDLTATILEAANVKHPGGEFPISGRSLLPILVSDKQGVVEPDRKAVFSGRERHSSSRFDNLSYSQRVMRTPQYLYIRNFTPDRWPAGDPQTVGGNGALGPMHGGYHDIDDSPTLDLLVKNHADPKFAPFLELAVAKRPAEEMFDITKDPECLKNLAQDTAFAAEKQKLSDALEKKLRDTGDTRMNGTGANWEGYPRYSPIRRFPPPR